MDQFTKKINDRLWDLWEDHCPEGKTALVPFQYEQIRDNPVLFVGLNPSFSQKNVEKRIERVKTDLGKNWEIFQKNHRWTNHSRINRKILAEWWESYKGPAPFPRFEDLAKQLVHKESAWTYIDLFAWRETKQNKLRTHFSCLIPKGNEEFWEGQLEIVFDIIKHFSPKIILVQNAFARDLFIHYAPQNDLRIDGPIPEGYFYWLKRGTNRIPLFFSGMLYGRGALDKDSFERLKWCMEIAVQKASAQEE